MRCDPERAHTQSVALVGQGAARDLVCQALLRLAERYPVVTAYLRGFVHDEVILSVPEHEASLWQERLREAFTFTWKDVPILCDVSAPGLNWAACYDGE
jgi:DNA polymerase I-like protein with 3'-5' exonuclease and polymerase domains